jgi:L-lysine exporter family protein LysE/ArgO
MSQFLNVYFAGLALSTSLIIAIGAQNAHVLRQGIKREHVFLVAGLCTFTDMSLIALGTAGFGSLIARFTSLTSIAAWGGAGFLFYYGFMSFRLALSQRRLIIDENAEGLNRPKNLKSIILLTLAVSLLNPHVYLDTFILIGGLAAQYPNDERVFFGLGAATASLLWFFGLAYGARLLEPLFRKPVSWRVLDMFIGIVMWSIAISLVVEELLG